MTAPWLDDGDVQLYHGDAWAVLNSLPDGCAQTCVTSPPYWGLRDYGSPGQLGLEDTVDEYVRRLVEVFRAVWFALRDDGTVWLNLGDTYASGPSGGQDGLNAVADRYAPGRSPRKRSEKIAEYGGAGAHPTKPKDLCGIPWRVAFALQADGWYLRSDIIWAKPNPMPESVTDRPTKAHEYVFLLAKQPRYYFDADAVREAPAPSTGPRLLSNGTHAKVDASRNDAAPDMAKAPHAAGRNARSVWEIATQPTPEAHFATYPEALVRRCILAGTSEAGGCAMCGAPWQRQTEREKHPTRDVEAQRAYYAERTGRSDGKVSGPSGMVDETRTTGWAPSCACVAPPVPQQVLDPFVGSGTTALVARKHGRRATGIDLSADYLAIAARRLGQQSLFAQEPAAPPLVAHRGLTGGAYSPPGQSPHSNARDAGGMA